MTVRLNCRTFIPITLAAQFIISCVGICALHASDEPKKLSSVYVDNVNGDDTRGGSDASCSVKTFKRALVLVSPTGTLHLKANPEPYRETLAISNLGEEGKPFTVEGNGAVIDFGCDASAGPWEVEGDAYVLKGDYGVLSVEKFLNQKALVFVNGIPVSVPRLYDREPATPLKPGEANFTADGKMRIRFPAGIAQDGSKVILPGKGGCVTVDNSYAVIRNLTVCHAGNDGFGVSGKAKTLLLERICAMWNSDEGISAHGESRVIVRDSVIVGNGSKAGGAFDVDNTVTSYERVLSMGNRNRPIGATNAKLEITDCLSVANGNGFQEPGTGKGTIVVRKSADYRNMPEEVPDNLKPLLERAKTLLLKP